MRIYRNLYSHMAEEEKKVCHETYKKLVKLRDLYSPRSAHCTAVKEDDGPFNTLPYTAVLIQYFL